MNTFVRIASLVAVLGIAGLLAGCVTHEQSTGRNVRHARDFEIVETSTKRNLTSKEMAQLRVMVSEYLQKEGATESGDYYVKVFLTPEQADVPAEWVVVRYTNPTVYTATRFSLLSSYPSYYEPYSYYSYDYYPFSTYGFGRLSFQYYDDPFNYGYRSYFPRRHYADRGNHGHRGHHGHHGNRNRDPDRDRDDHRPPYVNRPPSHPQTPTAPRVTTRQRWDANSPDRSGQPRDNNFPNRSDPRHRWQRPNVVEGQPTPSPVIAPAPAVAQPVAPQSPGERTRPSRITTRHGNPAENTTPPTQSTTTLRPGVTTRQREPSPSDSAMPARTSPSPGRQHATRQVQTAASPTPARIAPTPVPSYTPAATRSEPESQPTQRSNVNDGGRRARTE